MDIRTRLLLAFAPLLVLLVGTAISLPIIQRQSQAITGRQFLAADTLDRLQSFEVSILREHAAIISLVEGEADAENVALFRESREGAQALLDVLATAGPAEAALVERYMALRERHDAIFARYSAGDRDGADDLLDAPAIDELVGAIRTLGDEARVARRAEFDAASGELARSQSEALRRAALSTVMGIMAAILLTWVLVGQVSRPLDRLTADAERYAAGDLSGELSPGGNTTQVRRLRDAFQRLLDANQGRQQRLREAMAELEGRIDHEASLRATVDALSVPVMPLRDDTLLLPLVGHFDERRAGQLTRNLLEAIRTRRTRMAVLDLTGLAALTDTTAALLRETAVAARLLGCQVTLVGVRAEQATILAGADLAASGIATARDIPGVLAATPRPRG